MLNRSLLAITLVSTLFFMFLGCTTDPNERDCITEITENVNEATTWGESCATVTVLEAIDVQAELTIAPSTVVKMADGTDINVDDGGSIYAVGDSRRQITIEGVSRRKGAWNGIAIETQSERNRFEWVTIRDAGGIGFKGHPWVFAIAGGSTSPGSVNLERVTIEHSEGIGLVIRQGGKVVDGRRLTFRDIDDVPAMVACPTAEDLDDTFIFEELDKNYVLVTRGTITTINDWAPLDVPYRVQQGCEIADGGGLHVAAGSTLMFEQDVQFESNDGYIAIQGTPEEPVTLTGVEEIPGYWGGLSFESLSSSNVVEYAVVEYAGARVRGNWEFGVFVSGDATTRGLVEIKESQFRYIDGDGIYIRNGGHADINNVSFESIAGFDINNENVGS